MNALIHDRRFQFNHIYHHQMKFKTNNGTRIIEKSSIFLIVCGQSRSKI